VIRIKEQNLARVGDAVDMPDKDFYDVDLRSDQVVFGYEFDMKGRAVVDSHGDFTVTDYFLTEHSPLVFGNPLEESWEDIMKRLERDPLFKALTESPQMIVNFAEEYEPGIAGGIMRGKPGDVQPFYYWLLSKPERKLYVTYRLQQNYLERGEWAGDSPLRDIGREELKELVRRQAEGLRADYRSGASRGEPASSLADKPVSRVPETAARDGHTANRLLRDPLDEKSLALDIRNAILSVTLKKKVVLIFDTKLNSLQTAKAVAVFKAIEDLKKASPVFEMWLRGRLEVRTGLAELARYQADKDAEVFVFARADNVNVKAAENTRISMIDESQFPSDAYYPLAEIVAIALANYLDPQTIDHVRPMLAQMNIESILPQDSALVFRLLPSARRYDVQKDIYERYARFTQLLIAA
jgi:hypothetical protein